jgi:hypothetical protein
MKKVAKITKKRGRRKKEVLGRTEVYSLDPSLMDLG